MCFTATGVWLPTRRAAIGPSSHASGRLGCTATSARSSRRSPGWKGSFVPGRSVHKLQRRLDGVGCDRAVVSTLHFETDAGDGFREPGFSKERPLDPRITIGLLTDAAGFPLMVEAFEGNRAETKTILRVIEAFMAAHRLTDVTVVADAGMISDANRRAIGDAGLSFILGMRVSEVPYQVDKWHRSQARGARMDPRKSLCWS